MPKAGSSPSDTPVSTAPQAAAIILAAGSGTRMKSALPKVLHKVAGRALLGHAMATVEGEGIAPIVVVVGPEMEAVAAAAQPHTTVLQADRLGTGHAVLQAKKALGGFAGDILVAYGDTPFVKP